MSLQLVGITEGGSSYSCAWLDYDNDGDLDIYVARGQTFADLMYKNNGGTFTEVAGSIGLNDLLHSSCVSAGDFNNDGYLDLYLNNNGSANRLFKNSGGSNKWVIFKLEGVNSNRSAIGSRVTIKTGALTQIREVEGGSGGKGQNSLPVEFGIGSASIIDSVIIRWANGLVQRFANVQPNHIITAVEGQPLGAEFSGVNVPTQFSLEQNYPNPFNSSTIIRYKLAKSGHIRIKVYDIAGKEIAEIVNKTLQPGTYQTRFDGDNLSSGVYFYKFEVIDRNTNNVFVETKRMLMIK